MVTDTYIPANNLKMHIRAAGGGPHAIIFIHGNSCSADYWDDQLNDRALQRRFRLIAIDLPGHGRSDRAPDYSLGFLSEALAQLIRNLSLNSYILCGLSYGTALIAETAPGLTGCRGFFLASPNITSDAYPPSSYILPFPELLTMISATADEGELERFAAHLTNDRTSPLVQRFCKSYQATDPRFRTDLGIAMQQAAWSDEFSNLIETGRPVMYIFGESELTLNIHYMDSIKLPANHFLVFLKHAAHFVNNDQSEKFNGLLLEFCNNAFS